MTVEQSHFEQFTPTQAKAKASNRFHECSSKLKEIPKIVFTKRQ
jgi:hypothetical protein